MSKDFPHGFVLSEAAQYAFLCQDVYPDIVSFAAAIPDHLKPLFLIPVKFETVVASDSVERVASVHVADEICPSGHTDESDLFGTKTFTYDDFQPTVPQTDPGSIFDVDGADEITHHQEYNYDENLRTPSDTSYMSDVDVTQYWDYPYRTKQPVRHSFDIHGATSALRMLSASGMARFRERAASIPTVLFLRISVKPEALVSRTPDKIKKNAASCTVKLISYNKKNKVFTFSVTSGKTPRTVQAFLSEIDQVALSCDCPFWRWNGPEFHAKSGNYMLGQPFGTASPPNVRDPDRKYFICKHAYAVLKRLDKFVGDILEENWDLDEEEQLEQIDKEWDRLSAAVKVPLENLEKDDIKLEIDWSGIPDEEPEEEPEEYEVPPEEKYEMPSSAADRSKEEAKLKG